MQQEAADGDCIMIDVNYLRDKWAFVFPGQGSQYVGMGKLLYESSPAARAVFERADEVLGFPLSKLCFEGPADELQDTINAQPAILTVSIAALEALKEKWGKLGAIIAPRFVAGHSLGEYTALVAAGSLSFEDTLLLVRERGRLMKEADQTVPGGMAAVIGLQREEVEQVCEEAQELGVVVCANANSPVQNVISGDLAALNRAMELAKQRGAQRVARLAVSIASHSPLMQQAGEQLARIIENLQLSDPSVPIIGNLSGQALTTADEIKRELVAHLVGSVQWSRSVRQMVDQGISNFMEIGPGSTLSGLIKRISDEVETMTLSDADFAKV